MRFARGRSPVMQMAEDRLPVEGGFFKGSEWI